MEKATCGFCHRDNSQVIEEVCGNLHVEKLNVKYVAAHHKCLQYSAQLIQYKFDSFGGFKIDKVLEEIKRGKYLKCTVCKPMKGNGKKSKDGYNVNGATAGCALMTCKKTFHYCCAYSDPTAITKRMLIKNKDQGKQVIMYRVFCSLNHEKEYRSNKSELFRPFQSGRTSSSDSSSEDEDDNEDEEEDDDAEDEEEDDGEEENDMCNSDNEGSNHNSVDAQDNNDEFDSFIGEISMLSEGNNNNVSATKDKVRSRGTFGLMLDDEDDDDEDDIADDLSPQLQVLNDNRSDEDQKDNRSDEDQNEPLATDNNSKNKSATSNLRLDRTPDTPNSIKVKAQINYDCKSKNSTEENKGMKRSCRSKLRNDGSSDDDIITTSDNRNRPQRRCTKNTGTNSQKKSSTVDRKKNTSKRIDSSSSDRTDDDFMCEKEVKKKQTPKKINSSDGTDDDFMCEKDVKKKQTLKKINSSDGTDDGFMCEKDVKKKQTPKKINSSDGTDDGFMIEKGVKKKHTQKRICSSSDSTDDDLICAKQVKKKHTPKKLYISSSNNTDDDFISDKDVKKKYKKCMQSVEKRKNESDMDNSPVKMNLNKVNGAESSSRKDKQAVLNDQKSLNNIQTKSVIRDLSITLERIDCDKSYHEFVKDNYRTTEQEDDLTNKKSNRMDNNVCKRLGSNAEKSISKKPKLSENDENNTGNQLPRATNCYLNLENDTSGSSTESKVENHKYSTCGLILTQDLNYSDSIRLELLEKAEKELGVEEENLAFWLDAFKMEKLQKEIMPHLMNDIGQKLCSEDSDKGEIATLLTTADKLHSQLPNYSYVVNLYKSMDKSLVQNMQENMFKQLRNNLSRVSKKFGYTVGKLLIVQNMNALILTVNDKLDPKCLIRKEMSPVLSNQLFQCSTETRLHVLSKGQSKLQKNKEQMKIINFIRKEFEEDFVLQIKPSDEDFFSADFKNSSVIKISDSLYKLASEEDVDNSNHVLCVCPVDTSFVSYSDYCKKMLTQNILQINDNEDSLIIIIIHLDSSIDTVDDIISSVTLEECDMCVLTSHDPKQHPVSCVIVTNIPYKRRKSTAIKSTPQKCLPHTRITKEVTQVIRSSPRKSTKESESKS